MLDDLSRATQCGALLAALALVPSIESALAIERPTRVAGLDELVVYDPGTHDRGLPAVEFQNSPDGVQVEVAPTVHVHRYYFNGTKEFQGPLVMGGPTIVVANHPRTGKKMYIQADLPSGAPLITHTKHEITYTYPERRVVLAFSRCGEEQVHISFLPGCGKVRAQREKFARKTAGAREPGELCKAVKDAGVVATNTVGGAVGAVGTAAGCVVRRSTETVKALPGIRQLQDSAEQRAEQLRTDAATRGNANLERISQRILPRNP